MAKFFHVSDGKLILTLEPAGGGWYAVTSPFERGLITQAKSIEQAFEMAYDAQQCLREARAELASRFGTDPTVGTNLSAQDESANPKPAKISKPAKARARATSRTVRKSRGPLPDRTEES